MVYYCSGFSAVEANFSEIPIAWIVCVDSSAMRASFKHWSQDVSSFLKNENGTEI